MKNSILTLLAAFGMNALVAQNTPSTGSPMSTNDVNTPATVSNKFKADYPNITPTWQMEDENYSARYRDQLTNLDRVFVYDRFGNLVRSDYELDYASYPKPISDYYVVNYPREDYKVWSSKDESGTSSYFSKHGTNTVVWFDKDGKVLPGKPAKSNHKLTGAKGK